MGTLYVETRQRRCEKPKIAHAADLQCIKRDQQTAPRRLGADLVRERRERLCEGARIIRSASGAGITGNARAGAGRSGVDRGEVLQCTPCRVAKSASVDGEDPPRTRGSHR